MKNRLSYILPATIIVLSITGIACNKPFDEPPVYEPPVITPDLTIKELKAMHKPGQFELLAIDKTIGGIVIADDRSGQFFKTIVIQDETGGISIKLDAYDLYTSYPIGRKVYLKLNGLYLGDYNKLVEIGGGINRSGNSPRLDEIPSIRINDHLIKGSLDNTITPRVVTVETLNDSLQNTLIQLENYEFAVEDTSKTLAMPDLSSSAVNFTLQSCTGASIILRTSSYADFAGYKVQAGSGSLTAIYSVFGSTKQLNIRDSSDIKFYHPRCGSGGTGAVIPLKELRAFYNGSAITIGNYKISGIVISDAASKNISSGSMVLQDGDAGIKLYFGSNGVSTFNKGDSVLIDVSGGTLDAYNGALEISLSSAALPLAPIGTGKTILPKELTIAEITEQLPGIEYTLVKIKKAAVAAGSFSGNKSLTDSSGSMTLYTTTAATFSGEAVPAGSKTWTGYCFLFGATKEIMIRNTGDITDDDITEPPASGDLLIISEYVEGSSNNKYLEIYNAGTGAADLARYTVKMFSNGKTSASYTAVLSTATGFSTLQAGALIVLKKSSASLLLPGGIIAYNSSVCSFNGDDGITLEKDGITTDIFGEVGVDPGTSWTVSGDDSAAKDKSVRRKLSIKQGNTDWSGSAPAEWEVISVTDDVSHLGKR